MSALITRLTAGRINLTRDDAVFERLDALAVQRIRPLNAALHRHFH